MKTRFILTMTVLALFVTTAFAAEPVRRTIVVKDGKVISSDGNVLSFDGELLGGKRAWLGVSLLDISPELREQWGAGKDSGILVDSIVDDSPAAKAGLRPGDVIVAIDGKEVGRSGELRRALAERKEGDAVRIEILRGRARQTLVATLAEHEGPRVLLGDDLEAITGKIGLLGDRGQWNVRLDQLGDCGELQTRIKDLETRLKELEKKLQK